MYVTGPTPVLIRLLVLAASIVATAAILAFGWLPIGIFMAVLTTCCLWLTVRLARGFYHSRSYLRLRKELLAHLRANAGILRMTDDGEFVLGSDFERTGRRSYVWRAFKSEAQTFREMLIFPQMPTQLACETFTVFSGGRPEVVHQSDVELAWLDREGNLNYIETPKPEWELSRREIEQLFASGVLYASLLELTKLVEQFANSHVIGARGDNDTP